MFHRDPATIMCSQRPVMKKSRSWLNIMGYCFVKMDWTYLLSILKWRSKIDYLQIWKKTFTNKGIAAEHNFLHINEILLITPFTNAKLERVFNRMNRINAASRNRLHSVHWGINPLKNFTSSFLPSPSP